MDLPNEDNLHDMLLSKAAPELLLVIVNRSDGERTARLLQMMHIHFLIGCRAEGTAVEGLADLMGFGPSGKTLLLCMAPGLRMHRVLEELNLALHLEKPGRGIAFTIPLSGLAMPQRMLPDNDWVARIQKRLEGNVDNIMETEKNELILAVVNQGHSQALMECAREAGVTGGTVINARYLGEENVEKFFGVALQAEREIIAIVVTRENKPLAVERISVFLHENPKFQGALMTLSVDRVVGLNR